MNSEDQLDAIHLDWANGKVTLAHALREAYGLGWTDAMDQENPPEETCGA